MRRFRNKACELRAAKKQGDHTRVHEINHNRWGGGKPEDGLQRMGRRPGRHPGHMQTKTKTHLHNFNLTR